MIRLTEIRLPLDHTPDALRDAVLARLGIGEAALRGFTVFRRAVDARRKAAIVLTYTIDVEAEDEAGLLARHAASRHVGPTPDMTYRFPDSPPPARRPVVVGTGPCGLFAALILAQAGLRPLILERGKVVRERTKDTWALWRRGVLTPESNVQFGEGGAGTFSDGKLYSQISDPNHLGRKVLTEFVAAGAPEEILYVAHPHIGTFRLVGMVETMRATIERLGGEYRFGARVTDLAIDTTGAARQVRGVVLDSGETIETDHVILAIGHSSRDTFTMLRDRGVHLDKKPFAIGFRIEHPQSMIDRARYGDHAGHKLLGTADYKLVHRAERPQRLQLLHVPRRHRGRRHVRAGPRGHQRHEPVFAQRAQCQCRDRGRDIAGGFSGRRSGRRRTAAPPRRSGLCGGRVELQRARTTGR